MVRPLRHRGEILAMLVTCCMLRMTVGSIYKSRSFATLSHADQDGNVKESEKKNDIVSLQNNMQNGRDAAGRLQKQPVQSVTPVSYDSQSETMHSYNSQSETPGSLDSQSVKSKQAIPKNTDLPQDQSQPLRTRMNEIPKSRIKRTSSAIMLAAARRRLEERRRKKGGPAVRKYRPRARKVGTAVRLAAARRRVQVGGRRQDSNTGHARNKKEDRNREGEGDLENKRHQTNENEENRREEEERRRQIEESRQQAEDERRRLEESRRHTDDEKQRLEERRRLAEEERRRREESRRQLEERRRQSGNVGHQDGYRNIDDRNVAGADGSHHTDDERRARLEEEARRRGQGQRVQGQPTVASVTARDPQDIRHRCTECRVGDQTFRGHSRFEYVEGCIKHHCICRCDGTKECPDTHVENVCDGRDREPERSATQRVDSSCRTCDAKGQIIDGGKFFDLQEDCTLFRNCKCFCNGTWSCSEEKAETICVKTDQGTTVQNHNPKVNPNWNPKVNPNKNPNVNPNWNPNPNLNWNPNVNPNWNPNVNPNWNPNVNPNWNPNVNPNPNACQLCSLEGRQYQGNSTFQLINVCIATTCTCSCDGSVQCDPRSTVNICNAEATTQGPYLEIVISRNHEKIEDQNCQKCFVQGNPVDGNSKFNLKWSCYLDACFCDCQGRYSCVRQLADNLCDLSKVLKEKPVVDQDCHECFVEGRSYAANSEFRYTQGCTARDCKCTCSGSLECDERTAVNVCVTSPAIVDPQSKVFVPENRNPPTPVTCVQCNFNGSAIHGNSYFERREGCYIEQCHCQCDGRLNCRRIPGQEQTLCNETTVQVGSRDDQRICRRCLYQGTDYQGNTTFVYTNGCAATNCICRCHGDVDCDYTSTVNICDASATSTAPEFQITSTERPKESDQCVGCSVDGKEIAGGTDFELERGCNIYPCQCSCEGRWGCNIPAAKDICGREDKADATTQVSTRCRKCLHHGTEYAGDTRFQFTNSCVTINCQCECNGTVQCDYTSVINNCATRVPIEQTRSVTPATRPEPTTLQQRSDGCKSCSVDGNKYEGNTNFDLKRGCIVYPCQCHCSGRWGCMTDKARDVCKEDTEDETPEEKECQGCAVEGREYQGNTTFTHTHECTQRTCMCSCSGTVQCDDQTAVNVCNPPTTGNPIQSPNHQRTCHGCSFNGHEYQGNVTFLYTDSCTAKLCTCTCTGAVECDDTTAINKCTTTFWPVTRILKRNKKKEGCQGCSVEGQAYAGGSKFKLKRGCLAYPCHCDCSGRWWCDRENARNVCIDDEEGPDSNNERCFRCDVEGRRFPGGSEFRLRKGCISLKCKCACDGTWECPPELASNYCPGSTEATSPATEASPFK